MTPPLSPARERLMEALREMYAAGGRVGLNYALLDKLGFARSMGHIRSTYDEQHPVPSLSRVLEAVDELVAEERERNEAVRAACLPVIRALDYMEG